MHIVTPQQIDARKLTADQCDDLLLWRLLGASGDMRTAAAKEVAYTEMMERRENGKIRRRTESR